MLGFSGSWYRGAHRKIRVSVAETPSSFGCNRDVFFSILMGFLVTLGKSKDRKGEHLRDDVPDVLTR